MSCEAKQKLINELYLLVANYGTLISSNDVNHVLNRAKKIVKAGNNKNNFFKIKNLVNAYENVPSKSHVVDKALLLQQMAFLLDVNVEQSLENNSEQEVLNAAQKFVECGQKQNKMKNLSRLNKKYYSARRLTKVAVLSGTFTKDEMKNLLRGKNTRSNVFNQTRVLVMKKAKDVLKDYKKSQSVQMDVEEVLDEELLDE